MDECLRELQSLSVITKEQHHKLGTGEEEWEKVAEIIRKDAQKYLKLIDVLEHHEEAMSPVLIMLKKKYILCDQCHKIALTKKDGTPDKRHRCIPAVTEKNRDIEEEKAGDQGEAEPSLNPMDLSLPIEVPCPGCGKIMPTKPDGTPSMCQDCIGLISLNTYYLYDSGIGISVKATEERNNYNFSPKAYLNQNNVNTFELEGTPKGRKLQMCGSILVLGVVNLLNCNHGSTDWSYLKYTQYRKDEVSNARVTKEKNRDLEEAGKKLANLNLGEGEGQDEKAGDQEGEAEPSLNPMDLSLPIEENMLFIYEGDEHLLLWKGHGFELKFESGSLSRSVSEVNIDISTNLPGKISLPEYSVLVSEIFTVQCEHEFLKNVSLKMEHFAEDCSKLCFATSSGRNPTFTLNRSGMFDERYGIIQTKTFSCFAIVYYFRHFIWPFLNPKIECYAALYSKCVYEGYWDINLYIITRTEVNELRLKMSERDEELFLQHKAAGTIEYEADDIIMDISLTPKQIEDGWSLPPGMNTEIRIRARDVSQANKLCALGKFTISSTSKVPLVHAYNLKGANFNSLCLRLYHTEDPDCSDRTMVLPESSEYRQYYKCFGLNFICLHNKGIDGRGIKIAIIDSYEESWRDDGLQRTHKAMMKRGTSRVEVKVMIDKESKKYIRNHNCHALSCIGIAVGETFEFTCSKTSKKEIYPGGVASKAEATLYLVNHSDEDHRSTIAALKEIADKDYNVLSMSFGSRRDCYSEYLREIKKKTIIVAAAGNCGDRVVSYPARSEDVISVGALDMGFKEAKYSRSCENADISYIGEVMAPSSQHTRGDLKFVMGTSMATPGIAGIICLLIQCAKLHGYGSLVTKASILRLLKNVIVSSNDKRVYNHDLKFIEKIFNDKQLIKTKLDG